MQVPCLFPRSLLVVIYDVTFYFLSFIYLLFFEDSYWSSPSIFVYYFLRIITGPLPVYFPGLEIKIMIQFLNYPGTSPKASAQILMFLSFFICSILVVFFFFFFYDRIFLIPPSPGAFSFLS